ncbi:fumarylacetoacetate hydrolase family protein [Campylobacter geochelonis]|uniref:Fumarylacetoacetate hydrolase family protein n=1 Tax=Campylobacter geochelonis TaxID=1780362 RepID=A0A128EH98_9BACT|nr:fumarylacetoacetate hydrolase family protein [Campylobacter geochelonis]QKF71137.1 fumarylacetoacetate hydrolase family protein [Campylobacter geochelonis]CZE48255.1 fumarylacetoacetate hydrolase family protein [Campylobacter geochelonis]CZE48969.1 fumarylacetoacetate hydrolase family protein [Campylobacter geochelonis]CZE50041.1 fumarylacetoacetate hydrolase family protein [Campylobacter geochelonis]
MKLITYKNGNKFRLGVIATDGSVFDFSEVGLEFYDMSDFVINRSENDLKKLKELSLKSGGLSYEKLEKCAAIITPRQDIICLGLNYMAHAAESYKYKNKEFDGKREEAVYFSKRVNEAVGDGGRIDPHSNLTSKLDYEVELGVIIGKDAKNVSQKDAKEYIFGYTIINDISARDIQNRHKQWYFGKSLDTSTPMGPYIVTADELDSSNLDIKSFVNGELRQSSNTSLMIFDESFVIAELSAGMSLKAGTIISMGTPSGVGMGFEPPKFLKAGDEVVCEIEGIGTLRNYIC